MNHKPLITFISDFGTRDGYVGAVKGVIKSFNPDIEILDITHDIEPFNINMAAFSILNYYSQYPDDTIHLAVVDPGVGGRRKVIILKTEKYYFVGPDNGLFQFILQKENYKAFQVETALIYDSQQGLTFHARDIFAPVSAKLALGEKPENLGKKIDKLHSIKDRNFRLLPDLLISELGSIAQDHFGNIIFDYTKQDFNAQMNHTIKSISFKNFESNQIYDYYSQVDAGKPLFLWNSLGFLELAVNQGSAIQTFNFEASTDKAVIIFK